MNRILLWATLLSAATAVTVVLAVFGVLEWRDLAATAATAARREASAIASVVALTTDRDAIRAVMARDEVGAAGRVAVHLPDDRPIGATHATPAVIADTMIGGAERELSTDDGALLLLPARTAAGTLAVVEVYTPSTAVTGPLAGRVLMVALGGLVAVGGAGLVGRWRTQRLVVSIRAIANAARSVGEGRAGVPVPATRAAEVTRLVSELNQISRRVEQLIASEREFVADLSHRLRTPLTALRLDSESIGAGPVAERVRHAVIALEADVDDLIRTAARAGGSPVASCDAAKVVAERLAFWATLAEHQGRRCECVCGPTEAPIGMSDKDIGAVVDSLVGNIFQHTPAGTPFAAAVVKYAGWVTLVIEDGGPGIADTEAALRRGASSRGSTGLGLDIARHAVEATGGTIHIDRGRLGGARIRLRFAEVGSHHEHEVPKAWRLWSRSADPS